MADGAQYIALLDNATTANGHSSLANLLTGFTSSGFRISNRETSIPPPATTHSASRTAGHSVLLPSVPLHSSGHPPVASKSKPIIGLTPLAPMAHFETGSRATPAAASSVIVNTNPKDSNSILSPPKNSHPLVSTPSALTHSAPTSVPDHSLTTTTSQVELPITNAPAAVRNFLNPASTISIGTRPRKPFLFPLRGINTYDIWKRYKNGYYTTMIIPSVRETRSNRSLGHVDCRHGTNRYDDRFQETEGGRSSLIITTNQKDFSSAMTIINSDQDPTNIQLLKKGPCKWCRGMLEELPEDSYPVGIPVKVALILKTYIFHTIDKYCCFGCAYACLIRMTDRTTGSGTMGDCIPWLRLMFNLIHPGKQLTPAPEWDQHRRNGGEMEDHEYYSSRHFYYRRPNIITLPTKQECGVISRRC